MSQFRLSSLLLTALICLQVCSGLVIESANREVSLRSQRVLHATRLIIKNDGKTAEETITLCLPTALQQNAAILQVGELSSDEQGAKKLAMKSSNWATPAGQSPEITCADYSLSTPLAKGKTTEVALEASFTKVLKPRPAEIKQGDAQLMFYAVDTANVISPYKILKDTSAFDLGVEKPKSHSAPSPASMSGKKLKLGPYTSIPPFTAPTLEIHYENDFPTIEATSVVREIAISHWGNVYFEEEYELVHNGAKLKGEFSRFQTMVSEEASKGSAQQVGAVIPPSSRWIYFHDDIGNISTSKIITKSQATTVILIPRFPLFGGWKTKFIFGYSVPLTDTVGKDTSGSGKYAMVVSALPSVKDVVYDDVEVRIVLPEGAHSPKIESELVFEVSYDKTVTYFDVFPRTVLVLKKKNLIPESPEGLLIRYSYNPLWLLLKPLVLSGVCAVMFAAFVMLSGGSGKVEGANKLKTN